MKKTIFRYLLSLFLSFLIFVGIFFLGEIKYKHKKKNFSIKREIFLTKYKTKQALLSNQAEKNKINKITQINKNNDNSIIDKLHNNKNNLENKTFYQTKEIYYYPNFEVDYLPVYPTAAKRMHQQGTVTLVISVDKNANITNITIKQSSGYKLLDNAAIAGVKRWDYTKFLDGISTHYKITTKISFKLL